MASVTQPPGEATSIKREQAIRTPHLAVDDFLGAAAARDLRNHVETHFGTPESHAPGTHQVWNYWHVPRLYTYLRTSPEKVLPLEAVQRFHGRLTTWAKERLGLGHVSWPFLSLYVAGCRQDVHNDSTNGRFGYVYSLTPNRRKSIGGETIVFKEGDLFRSNLQKPDAGRGLYDLIAPVFDRLVIFDDRMPHGVAQIEGSMDPNDGRVVLHGHISESGAEVAGPLSPQAFQGAAMPAIQKALAAAGQASSLHHGPLVLRLTIAPGGQVETCRVLVDRVARSDGKDAAPLVEAMIEGVANTIYPEGDQESEVTLPLLVGGLLPWMPRRKSAAGPPA